jgi:hypothetical protein
VSDLATIHRLAPASARPNSKVARKAATIAAMIKAVRDLARRGQYRPAAAELIATASVARSEPARLFGSTEGLAQHVARHYAADVVDTLQLTDKARAALSDRDVRTIAMAVLGGRRLEAGQ